jgi:5-deoxy-glucuronate isomerase
MQRLIHPNENEKLQHVVPQGTMRFLDFARLRLQKSEKYSGKTGGRESVLDFFSGTASLMVEVSQGKSQSFHHVGTRADVFGGPPVMLYLPAHANFHITALSDDVDIGIFSASSSVPTPPTLFNGSQASGKQVGKDNWQRTVYSVLDEKFPAERLLAGETYNPPGNWSSYPPHKHDRNSPPGEAVLEEIYFFRVKPAQGFGFIYTYTAPDDPEGFSNVFVVHDGDTVLLPKGYHPVVAAPGYALHYTWVLAGEERRYGAWADDPDHTWVKNQ